MSDENARQMVAVAGLLLVAELRRTYTLENFMAYGYACEDFIAYRHALYDLGPRMLIRAGFEHDEIRQIIDGTD